MTDAPERIWAWGYDGYQNVWGVQKPDPNHVKIVGEYIRADLHKQALDAAREEGRRQGLEEAAKYHIRFLMERTSVPVEKVVASTEAIRALIDKPGDPVAEADSFDALICDAKEEAERAMQKFPQPNYVISKVAEEAGEVVKAAIHCAEGREEASEVRGEMKQLVAMLYRLWVEGDGVHGLRALAQKQGE